jgi:hypothetical protein
MARPSCAVRTANLISINCIPARTTRPRSKDIRPAPLEQRKGKLEKLLARSDGIQFSEHLAGDGVTIFAHACKLGLEGIVSSDGT